MGDKKKDEPAAPALKKKDEPAAPADKKKDEPAAPADKKKDEGPAAPADKKKDKGPAAPADKKKKKSSANPHLKQLQKTIEEFESNVKSTLDATQKALGKQTDDVQAKRNKLSEGMKAYQTTEKMRMKAKKIP